MLAGGGPVAIADHQLVAVLHVADGEVDSRTIGFRYVQNRIGSLDGVVIGIRRVVFRFLFKADGPTAFGILLAEQAFAARSAALLAEIEVVQQSGDLVEPAAGVNG